MYFPLKYLIKWNYLSVVHVFILIFDIHIILGAVQVFYSCINGLDISLTVTGSFRHSGIFSIYLASFLPIRLNMTKSKLDSIFSWNIFVLLLVLLLVLSTHSRTGLFLYIINLIFLFYTYIRSFYFKSSYKAILLTMTIIFSTVLITTLIYLKIPSALGRLFIWQNSFEMFCQKPIFGWGFGGFEKSYLNQQAIYFKNNLSSDSYKYKIVAEGVSSPFNEYLKILVEYGIIGVVCLTIAFKIIWKFSRNIRNKKEYSFLSP
ncbi:O-antigen ligase family protein [Pedobacter steynii]